MAIFKSLIKALSKLLNGNSRRPSRKRPLSAAKKSPRRKKSKSPSKVGKKKSGKSPEISTLKNLKPKIQLRKTDSKRLTPSPEKNRSAKLSPEKKTPLKSVAQQDGILVGEITHFFNKIQVCVLKITGVGLKLGDQIQIRGKTRPFSQKVKSLQIESADVPTGKRGQLVGLKLEKPAQVGDCIYKV